MEVLSFANPTVYESARCFVTYGIMGHLDPKQLPSKSKPWTTLQSQDFIRKVDLLLPQSAFDTVSQALADKVPAPEFKRVILSLHDILSGEFFTEYVKNGSIMMLSEGRVGIDNVFSLKHGQLTMFLDKEAYERAGLVGKPHGVKGKRGLKPRWLVEVDLQSQSMVPGKKGFKRLIYASKNALNVPMTWLFCNLSTTPEPDPLAKHFPTKYTSDPAVVRNIDAVVPPLKPAAASLGSGGRDIFDEFAEEVYEWLSLVRLGSPRISPHDQIDPYLCRYRVPGESEEQQISRLCKITWQGFISPSWARKLLVELSVALPSKAWYSFSTTAFATGLTGDGPECSVLRPPNSPGEYVMWEIKGHE